MLFFIFDILIVTIDNIQDICYNYRRMSLIGSFTGTMP